MSIPFLTAEWRHLLLFNYAVSPETLSSDLPPKCELDLQDGKAFLSLVAFQFLNTKVMGVAWPGFVNFPEINLRFYIRQGGRRGVCFVREYVPSALVARIAKGLFNEPYCKAKMSMHVEHAQEQVIAKYSLRDGDAALYMEMVGAAPVLPAENSMEHFFKEHSLGVGRDRQGRLLMYEVEHPFWQVFPVLSHKLEIPWAKLYGKRFAFLQEMEPHSMCFAEGSGIRVMFRHIRRES